MISHSIRQSYLPKQRKGPSMADAAAEIEESGWKRTVKDLFSGAAGGIAQVLIGEL